MNARFHSLSLTTLTNWRKPDSKEMDLWEVGYRFEDKPEGNGKVMIRREKREFTDDNVRREGGTDLGDHGPGKRASLSVLQRIILDGCLGQLSSRQLPKAVEIMLVLDDGSVYLTQVDVEAGRY